MSDRPRFLMLSMRSDKESLHRWLTDIGYHIAKAQSFVEGMSYETFRDDDLRFYATTRCLEIISEATRRLPDELKERHSSIPWQEIAAAGNVYRHEYDHVAPGRGASRS